MTAKVNVHDDVFYVEELPDEVFADRSAIVMGHSERCAVCLEKAQGHARRGRQHVYTPIDGVSLRVTFPEVPGRRATEEVVEYPFVVEGDAANQWHE